MLVLAHAGHWLPYVIPAVVVLVAVVIATLRERRRGEAGENEDPDRSSRPKPGP